MDYFKHKPRFLASIILTVVFAVTGCASVAEEADIDNYVAPAWMAEVRAEREDSLKLFRACLESSGISFDVASNGAILPYIQDELSQDLIEVNSNAISRCQDQREPLSFDNDSPSVEYERMVETHACLTANGFPISEPPSKEVWVEQFRSLDPDLFLPYFELDKLITAGSVNLSEQELGELQQVCVATKGGGSIESYNINTEQ